MKNFLLFFTAVMLFSACNQTKPTFSPDRVNILRSGRWKVVSGTVTLKKPNGLDTTLNYMPFVPPCHLDDYIKFDSGNHGATFPGTILCYASDADSIGFIYNMRNNDNNIDLLNIFNLFQMVYETINTPYYFDTVSQSPLVLDTIQRSPYVILDTMWSLRFDSVAVSGNSTVYPGANVYNADISNFSKSGFTLSFKWYGTYPDSTGGHEGGPPNYASPIMRNDTLKFVLNFSNF